MELPKGSTLNGELILTSSNHGDYGNPHAQYCKSITRVFFNKEGYAMIYKKTLTMQNQSLIIKGLALATSGDTPSFDFLAQINYRDGSIRKASISGNENIFLLYKKDGNSFTISIYIKSSALNNYTVIPELDICENPFKVEYKCIRNPFPLLREDSGFLFMQDSILTELPTDYTIVNAN